MNPETVAEHKTAGKKVLLVGWDGADWEHIKPLLEKGLMPNLEALINRGVMGNLATMQPVLSPMLWNTIATGKLPDQHGICGFMEPDPVNGGARPVTSISRKVKAIWNILSQSGLRSNVIGWWASHPAEPIHGHVISDNCKTIQKQKDGSYVVPPGTIHPAEVSDLLAPCFVSTEEITEEDIYPFIPDAFRIDEKGQKLLQGFVKILSNCATIQAMATAAMSRSEWDFTAVYFTAIDHFCHSFMPFCSPRMPQIDEDLYEIFKGVIDGAYRFHDIMLGAQLALAGDDALVVLCSDHGFLSGDRRPLMISNEPAGPADWHRDLGMIVMAGPGVKQDERLYGATLIDITPTILAYLGLPVGRDMQGRPLTGAFERLPAIESVESWESIDGEDGMHPPGTELSAEQSDELRQQFVALGYVDDHGQDKEKGRQSAETEIDYNLARVYLSTSRPELARELLEKLVHRYPWEIRFIRRLAHAYFLEGYYQQCIDLIEATFPDPLKTPAMLRLVKGRARLGLGQQDLAMQSFLGVLESNPANTEVHVMLGRVFMSLKKYDSAKQSFQRALEIDPDKAIAHQGLARVYLSQRCFDEAAESALDAVSVLHHLPRSHFVLGQALARLGHHERAAQAFETSLHLNPKNENCHRMLEVLYRKWLANDKKAEEHAARARSLGLQTLPQRKSAKQRHTQRFELPKIPSREERLAILAKERPAPNRTQPVKPGSSDRTFVIVSGLPRSGTSLMMQMLQIAGLNPKTDGQRVADIDNPQGYYEWEAIKQIRHQPQLMDEEGLDHKAIKVISMLLGDLPIKHRYKIIFMRRPVDEIAASQRKMIGRLETAGANLESNKLAQQLLSHRRTTLTWLAKQENVDLQIVDFPKLVSEPAPVIQELVEFLGSERLPFAEKMSQAIRSDLYRQKRIVDPEKS